MTNELTRNTLRTAIEATRAARDAAARAAETVSPARSDSAGLQLQKDAAVLDLVLADLLKLDGVLSGD